MAPSEADTDSSDPKECIPQWLNKAFFADFLEKKIGKYEIKKFNVGPALKQGENFTSLIHEVIINIKIPDGSLKTVTYLTKSILGSEISKKKGSSMIFFAKEIEMYGKILPQMETLYKKVGTGVHLGAECILLQNSPPVIVLEDLTVKNYTNANRLEGLDLKHTEATLEKMAQWHAVSTRIFELRGAYSDHFSQELMWSGTRNLYQALNAVTWPAMKESIPRWGEASKYLPKIKRIHEHYIEKLYEADKVHPLEFNVLNHGDAWCNNIMYKHKVDGSIEDVKFLDLQHCKWGSPAQDLLYFIFSSCHSDIKVSRFDYLIQYYHQHLVKNLKLLEYSETIPSLIDLHVDLLKKGFVAYSTSMGAMSAILLGPSKEAFMDLFLQESEAGEAIRRASYTNPRFIKGIQKILPFLHNRGILD